MVDDNQRYIYFYIQTSSTICQFWCYDTWRKTFLQLKTPPTQTGSLACMVYDDNTGGQWNGRTYGGVYLFTGNVNVCYLYKYDRATDTWASALSTTGISATFSTDCYMSYPAPAKNNWEGNYHSGTIRTITLGASVAVGATSATVAALPEALAVGTRLRFGTFNITLTAPALKGSTSLTVSALPQDMAQGTLISIPILGIDICLSSAASASATTLSVFPIQRDIPNATVAVVEQYIVLTAAAAASATSLTIAPALYSIANSATAFYYGNFYLIGNNSTAMFRYNKGGNAWSTTSSNSGNPALPAMPGAIGTGCSFKWLPSFSPSKLWILRGGATSSIYIYDLDANTVSNETYYPSNETFTTGTCVASRTIRGKQSTLLIQKDTSNRIFEGNPTKNMMELALTQDKIAHGTAIVGEKSCCITTPDGIEFYYMMLNSSTGFVRTALLDS
jgi:hypothetical protein